MTGAQVTVEHLGTDPLCGTGETHVAGTTVLTSLGRVNSAPPYGSWTVKVVGRTPVGAWPTITLDPTVPGVVTALVRVS